MAQLEQLSSLRLLPQPARRRPVAVMPETIARRWFQPAGSTDPFP
jgi:hypothetical protein